MNLTKRNFFLTLILLFISVVFPCMLQADFLDHKSIELEQLHLYKIIISIKAACLTERIEAIQRQEESSQDFELTTQSPLKLVELALQEMKDIVAGLNKGLLASSIEIEYKFVNLCNFLQDKKITSRALRELREKINEFDLALKTFCKRKKYYLKPEAFELVNKMIRFNHMLNQGVLDDNYFDLSIIDLSLDLIFYRPLEFANKHKFLIGGAALAVCALIAAVYGYPIYVAHQLTNRNPNYQCRQLHGFSQPLGSGDCGLYALVHTLLLMNPGHQAQEPAAMLNADAIQDRLNAIPSLNPIIEQMQMNIRNYRAAHPNVLPDGWLRAEEIQQLLNPNTLQTFAAQLHAIGINQQALDLQDIHIVELHNDHVANDLLRERNHQLNIVAVAPAIDRFRRLNRAQGIILFMHGHWVSLRLQRDAQGIVQPLLLNSSIQNITNHPVVNQIIELFTQQAIASPHGLANIAPSLETARGILNGNGIYPADADRAQAVLNHLSRAIGGIQAAPADQRAQEFAYYQQNLTDLFNNFRNACLGHNLHQIATEQAPHLIDLDHVQTIDQLIIALVGHPFA